MQCCQIYELELKSNLYSKARYLEIITHPRLTKSPRLIFIKILRVLYFFYNIRIDKN